MRALYVAILALAASSRFALAQPPAGEPEPKPAEPPPEPAPKPGEPPPAPEPKPAEVKPAEAPPEPANAEERAADEAKPGEDQGEHLAMQLTNPIADLVSIPFQFNWNNGIGPNDALQMNLNIQPVVPFHLTKHWNMIGRYIVPIIAQPPLIAGSPPTFGMGDIVASLFLSPRNDSKFTWGIGPVFGLPGGVDPTLNSGKWSIGPTAVGLYLSKPWTIGVLVNQLWSFASTSDTPRGKVSQMFLQPFVSFTKGTWTLTGTSEMTFDWEASSDKAQIPLELFGSKLTKLGFLPFSLEIGGSWFAATSSGGPDWRLRLNLTVLLPSGKTVKKMMEKR